MSNFFGIEVKNLSTNPQEAAINKGKGFWASKELTIASDNKVWTLVESTDDSLDVHMRNIKVVVLDNGNSTINVAVKTWEGIEPTYDEDVDVFNGNRNLDNGDSGVRINTGDSASADTSNAVELTPLNIYLRADKKMIAHSIDVKKFILNRDKKYSIEIDNSNGNGEVIVHVVWEWFTTNKNRENWN